MTKSTRLNNSAILINCKLGFLKGFKTAPLKSQNSSINFTLIFNPPLPLTQPPFPSFIFDLKYIAK